MKITVLEAGRPPPPLDSEFGTYPELFGALLNGEGGEFEVDSVQVHAGEPLPSADSLEAVLITGSPAGVYDEHEWIASLAELVRELYAAGTPMVGICFGHQIIAHALGGEVRKSEKGWGIGRHVYSLQHRPPFMADAPDTIAVPASHQDQVIAAPANARVIAGSEFTPNAALIYDSGKAVSFQPHPEFSPAFASALYDMRHRGWLGDEATDAAIASLDAPNDNALLAGYIARFFRGASGQ